MLEEKKYTLTKEACSMTTSMVFYFYLTVQNFMRRMRWNQSEQTLVYANIPVIVFQTFDQMLQVSLALNVSVPCVLSRTGRLKKMAQHFHKDFNLPRLYANVVLTLWKMPCLPRFPYRSVKEHPTGKLKVGSSSLLANLISFDSFP